jgi:reactive intermediate/imine deaminase
MSGGELRRIDRVHGVGDPVGPYSHAVASASELYVSGQVAIDADGHVVGRGDCAAQARQAYRNLAAVLGAVGCDWRNVLKMTVYLTDMEDLPEASAVRRELMDADSYPASTVVEVSRLADPEWMIEIEAVVSLPARPTTRPDG